MKGSVERELGEERGRNRIRDAAADAARRLRTRNRVRTQGVVAHDLVPAGGHPDESLRDPGARSPSSMVPQPRIQVGLATAESGDIVNLPSLKGGASSR